MNVLDASYHVVHDYKGGAQALGLRLGKNGATLSHEVAGFGTAKLGLLDTVKITHMTGDLRILEAWAGEAGQMLVPLPRFDVNLGDDCMLRLAATVKEFGDMCSEAAVSLQDGCVTDNELARFDRECGELIAAVHSLRQALQERNIASKPSFTRQTTD